MKRLCGWLILLATGYAGASAVDSALRYQTPHIVVGPSKFADRNFVNPISTTYGGNLKVEHGQRKRNRLRLAMPKKTASITSIESVNPSTKNGLYVNSLPAAEIVDLAADGHDSLTGAVVERTADSRSLWEFEVVARPRHPLFGFPLLVTAFSDFVPVERHGDFVAQQHGPRNPPAAPSDPRYRTPAGRPDPKELV